VAAGRGGYNAAVKRQTIIAGASIMMVATLFSRLLGWVRDHAIGNFWGSNTYTDAYWAAFMAPDLLYYLLAGGALSASVIPVFSGYLRRHEESESWRIANTLVNLFASLALVGIVFIVIFAPFLVMVVAPGFGKELGPEAVAQCASYVRVLAAMVFFTVLNALFAGILQAHRHFTAPALAWLVYSLGIIGAAFLGGHWLSGVGRASPTSSQLVASLRVMASLRILCLGVIVGAVLQVAIQLPSLIARGFRYRPTMDLSHPGVREVLRLFLPYMAGLAFTQICLLWLPSFFGSYFPGGGVTSLRYANRLVILPLGLFGVAISTAAFPELAQRIDAGEIREFRRLFSSSLRAVFFLSVPSAAALFVLSGPILRLLWRGGEFGERAVEAASFCLLFYAAALIGLSGLQIVNRAFYSLKDVRTPPLVGIGYTVIIVLLAILLMRTRLQYAAIAAATSLGVTIGLLILFEALRRRLGGIDGRAVVLSFLRVAVASAALGAVALAVSRGSGRILGVPPTHFGLAAPKMGPQAAGVPAEARLLAKAGLRPRTRAGQSAPPAPGPEGPGAVAAPTHRVALQVILSLACGGGAYLLVLRLLGAPELASLWLLLHRRRQRPDETARLA
jgi:putative peptidoglycan lipid II flippase